MVTVETRQNSKSNWWCNTTFEGYDISVESSTIEQSRDLIIIELNKRGYKDVIRWKAPKYYTPEAEIPKAEISPQPWRIDKGMV